MKKTVLYSFCLALISLTASAQQNANAVKFGNAINPEKAKAHLSILASDEFEGRETGKKGLWLAAEYIKKQFQSFGLKGPVKDSKDPYFQQIGFYSKKINTPILTIDGQPKTYLEGYYILPNTIAGNGYKVDAKSIIFAGYGINKPDFNEYQGQNVAGKVVMIFATGDPTPKAGQSTNSTASWASTVTKIKYLQDQKVAAVLLVNLRADELTDEMKAYLTKDSEYLKLDDKGGIPVINIGTAISNQILAKIGSSISKIKQEIDVNIKPKTAIINSSISINVSATEKQLRAENVLGFLEGSDPKLKHEVLVLTGHYDHIGLNKDTTAADKVYNGADDDGSGTTGVLLMAEAFANAKKAGKGPKRSILFMTVCGEEKGLLGSEWYAEHPVFPLKNTIVNLNTDMIGRTGEQYLGTPDSANYIYSVGSAKLSTELSQIQEKINNTYTKIKLDFKYDDPKDTERIYYRSDHYNFAKNNIPIIFYYDGMLGKDYHGLGDEVDKINFDLLTKRAHLTYYIAWELANRAKRPLVDKNQDGTPKK
jgi:hypothetical protein